MSIHSEIQRITDRIIARSSETRAAYLEQMKEQFEADTTRSHLSCGNLAHAFAGCGTNDKEAISEGKIPNLGIITAYNDMLSAHKPFENYPEMIRDFAQKHKAVAQVAGAVPAMCDGVTQGQPGMELSLYSRDVIALATTVGLSHNMFEGVINLGICDKIVPGLLIGNLKFGNLHTIFMPGGPMESGISNEEKARIRREYAEGKIDRATLLKGESDSYHSPGTCTFYGTANSNQMLMEIMGLQLPSGSFVNPGTELRQLLNEEAVRVLVEMINENNFDRTTSQIISEKTVVNGIIGLLATGGSTNHTIHLIAIAKAAGISIDWTDFSELSKVVPLLTRVYPNGAADVNHFHAAGGMGFVMRTLLENGLLHEDVNTILGKGLNRFKVEPKIENNKLIWVDGAKESLNHAILRPVDNPFSPDGGITMLKGNIGRSVMKKSAVDPSHFIIEAPAIVFDEQEDFITAFKNDELNKDFVAVLPFQGPQQNGMPELHSLTPTLTILQKRGHKVALVTDGRMSGASGKVPSAIHVTPEARCGGLIGKIRTGDIVLVDAENGILECKDPSISDRTIAIKDNSKVVGTGRELFHTLRKLVTSSEEGASFIL
ncbi:MAG: phosphogluconate dehydratase [Crocinitomicaceae bacterium]